MRTHKNLFVIALGTSLLTNAIVSSARATEATDEAPAPASTSTTSPGCLASAGAAVGWWFLKEAANITYNYAMGTATDLTGADSESVVGSATVACIAHSF